MDTKKRFKTRTGYMFKRGETYYVQVKVNGRVIIRSTGETDFDKAEVARAKIVAPFLADQEAEILHTLTAKMEYKREEADTLKADSETALTLQDTWQAYVDSPNRPDSGQSTLDQYQSEWKRFAKWMGENHATITALRLVTPDHAGEYAKHLISEKVSASTFNQHVNFLSLAWKTLAPSAHLHGNPWQAIARHRLTPLATRKRALTPAQFDALLAATETDKDLHDLLTLLAWTGLRLVDGVCLKWGVIDFQRNLITLAPQKTARRKGTVVYIPIFPAVLEILNRRQEGTVLNPKGHVFPDLVKAYEKDTALISKRITQAFSDAGMSTTEERTGRGREVTVYGAHSLRHYFVTVATEAKMPSALIKRITGHATDEMMEHYQQIGADLATEIAARMHAPKEAPALTAGTFKGKTPAKACAKCKPALLGILELMKAGKTQGAIDTLTAML